MWGTSVTAADAADNWAAWWGWRRGPSMLNYAVYGALGVMVVWLVARGIRRSKARR